MDTRLERCAGLDVHQATVVATVRHPDGVGGRTVETVAFDTIDERTAGAARVAAGVWGHARGVMRDGVTYQELGSDYFDRRQRERATRRHVKQLQALGYRVTIEQEAA